MTSVVPAPDSARPSAASKSATASTSTPSVRAYAAASSRFHARLAGAVGASVRTKRDATVLSVVHHRTPVLVAEDAEQRRDRLRRRDGANRLHQHVDAGWIVRDVEDESPASLKSPGHVHVGEMTRRLARRRPRSAHRPRRAATSEKARFVRLMAADERGAQRQSLAAPFDVAQRSAGVDHDVDRSAPRRTIRTVDAPARVACSTSRSRIRGSRSPITAGTPGLKMPAFSRGDRLERGRRGTPCDRGRSTSRPRRRGSTTFVESSRPPRPVSIDGHVGARAREVSRTPSPSWPRRSVAPTSLDQRAGAWSMNATTSSDEIGSPSTTMRSRKSTRCGDV